MSNLKEVSYCVGMSLGESLKQQNLESISTEDLAQAISDTFEGGQLKYTPEEANAIIQEFLAKQAESKFSVNKDAGEKFLNENKEGSNIVVTESGLQYEVITEGTGDVAKPDSQVTVHYHGTLIDGTVFDSSVERGEPATFGVNQVIPGWTEALQLMNKGAKHRLYIPENLAYGSRPHPGGPIEPYMALIFDVELIEIN